MMFPRFVCKDYVVGASDTIIKRSCSLDSTSSKLSCPKTPPGGSRLPTPAPRPSNVTNKPPTSPPRSPVSPSGPCLRSGKNCEEAVVTITSFEVQTAADGTEDPITAGVRTEKCFKLCSFEIKLDFNLSFTGLFRHQRC